MTMRSKKAALACAWLAIVAVPVHAAGRDKLLVVVQRADSQVALYKVAGATLGLVKSLPVGKTPREVCLSPDGTRAYVSAQEGNSVTVVDLTTASVSATIGVPEMEAPDGCAVSPDGKKLYVVSMKRNALEVFSTQDGALLKDVRLPLVVPRRVAFTPDGRHLYVGCNNTPEIAILDAASDSLVRTFKVGNEARGGLAFTDGGKTFLVGNVEDDTVSWVDTDTYQVVKTMGVPLSPQRIEVSKDGQVAYVLTRMGSREAGSNVHQPVLFVMPLKDKHDTSRYVSVGTAPWGLAVSDDGAFIYVSSNAENVVNVIDAKTLKTIANVPVGKDPQALAFRP